MWALLETVIQRADVSSTCFMNRAVRDAQPNDNIHVHLHVHYRLLYSTCMHVCQISDCFYFQTTIFQTTISVEKLAGFSIAFFK